MALGERDCCRGDGRVSPPYFPLLLAAVCSARLEVGADGSVGYECIGPKAFLFHHIFLGGWGMSIGELFDLRQLALECERLGRWTFLLTSMPLYVPGGIASPPNAQAIL